MTETSCYTSPGHQPPEPLYWDDPDLPDNPWDDRDVLVPPPESSLFSTCPLTEIGIYTVCTIRPIEWAS